MTTWKKERIHYNYYITNERKEPHIYIELFGKPSSKTERLIQSYGFKFNNQKSLYEALQTNKNRMFLAHNLDRLFQYSINLYINDFAKKYINDNTIQNIKDICNELKQYNAYIDIVDDHLFKICKSGSKSLVAQYNTKTNRLDTFKRNKFEKSYIFENGKLLDFTEEKTIKNSFVNNEIDYSCLPF